MISFVLFPETSEPSKNFNISKMVYLLWVCGVVCAISEITKQTAFGVKVGTLAKTAFYTEVSNHFCHPLSATGNLSLLK